MTDIDPFTHHGRDAIVSNQTITTEPLMTPGEVADLFRVSPKTVARWASAGKITAVRTLGGHRRYRQEEARALLEHSTHEATDLVHVGG